jgi:hypothetical protein
LIDSKVTWIIIKKFKNEIIYKKKRIKKIWKSRKGKIKEMRIE